MIKKKKIKIYFTEFYYILFSIYFIYILIKYSCSVNTIKKKKKKKKKKK